jgi:hypothetical protein
VRSPEEAIGMRNLRDIGSQTRAPSWLAAFTRCVGIARFAKDWPAPVGTAKYLDKTSTEAYSEARKLGNQQASVLSSLVPVGRDLAFS